MVINRVVIFASDAAAAPPEEAGAWPTTEQSATDAEHTSLAAGLIGTAAQFASSVISDVSALMQETRRSRTPLPQVTEHAPHLENPHVKKAPACCNVRLGPRLPEDGQGCETAGGARDAEHSAKSAAE